MSAAAGGRKKKTVTKENDIGAIERGDKPLSVTGHLTELRSRLLTVLAAICLATAIPFIAAGDKVLKALTWPFYHSGINQPLYVFNLTEGFMLQLKACLVAGIIIVFPLVVQQIWSFIKPAIDREKRGFYRGIIISSILLFYAGAGLTFFFLMPFAVKVLSEFTPQGMQTMFSSTDYLHFMLFFCVAMGAIAEMPMVIMILTKLGLITPTFLVKKRKWAIVIIWIAAAVITPTTDILTQTMVAVPLMMLYEISIVLSKIMVIRARRRRAG